MSARWLVIRGAGRIYEVEPEADTLHQLQELVGGYIETVPIPGTSLIMIINEEGKLLDLPVNGPATRLYNNTADVIVGPAVIGKVDLVDGVPDIVPATRAEWQTQLFAEL